MTTYLHPCPSLNRLLDRTPEDDARIERTLWAIFAPLGIGEAYFYFSYDSAGGLLSCQIEGPDNSPIEGEGLRQALELAVTISGADQLDFSRDSMTYVMEADGISSHEIIETTNTLRSICAERSINWDNYARTYNSILASGH
jgi:hypothetical protein